MSTPSVKEYRSHLKFNFGAVAFVLATLLSFLNVILNFIYQSDMLLENIPALVGFVLGSIVPPVIFFAFSCLLLSKNDSFITALPAGFMWLISAISTISNISSLINAFEYLSDMQLVNRVLSSAAAIFLTGAYFLFAVLIILHGAKRVHKAVKTIMGIITVVCAAFYAFFNLLSWLLNLALIIESNVDSANNFYILMVLTSALFSVAVAIAISASAIWFINPYKKGFTPEELTTKTAEATAGKEAKSTEAEGAYTAEDTAYGEATAVPVGNTAQESSHTALFKKYAMPIWQHALLMFFAGGIWGAIWAYRTTELINRTAEESRDPLVCALLYFFIPYYYVYWNYKTAESVDTVARKSGKRSDLAIICLIISLIISIVPPILIQDKINDIAEEK